MQPYWETDVKVRLHSQIDRIHKKKQEGKFFFNWNFDQFSNDFRTVNFLNKIL